MTRLLNKREYTLIATIILLLLIMSFFFSIALIPAYAEDFEQIDINNFDSLNVLDELKSAENFDIKNYPIYDSKEPVMVLQNFVEYCYSAKAENRGHYGLYVYLYNPTLQDIDINSYDNKIQMAVAYDKEGKPTNYEKFSLQFCSMATESAYKRLFYKFKVVDHRSKADNKTIAERVNSNARRYDISGIELFTSGNKTAIDYGVSKSYTYTGYAKGYAPDPAADSTLECNAEKLTTLDLKVEHTFYRTMTSNKGADYQNQIDTVYFSVPNEYFENHGELQRIKAEWYEYLTKPIVVTSLKEFYDKAKPIIGYNPFDFPDFNYYLTASNFFGLEWYWHYFNTEEKEQILYYLFPCDKIENYDPLAEDTEISGVDGNKLYQYILDYTNSFENGRLPIKDGSISADLFEKDIEDYRKVDNEAGCIQNGYSYYDFDADLDLKYLSTWQDTNPTFWDNWKKYGFLQALFNNIPEEEAIDLNPIQIFDYADLSKGDGELIKKYFIHSSDVKDFRAYASKSKMNNEKVVLFRFATTDYYNSKLVITRTGKIFGESTKEFKDQAYLTRESVFLNFDIIQLTFLNDDIYTVIPVVSSPIDIVDGITPPPNFKNDNGKDLLTKILTFILIGIALLVVVKIVWWLIKTLSKPNNNKPNNNSKNNKSYTIKLE